MSLFDYDFDDLARQIQDGLERIAVNFLRGHGARVHRDLVTFHGYEEIDLELAYGAHSLKVHQVGRPRGADGAPIGELVPGLEEEFQSELDGWPSANQPREAIAQWLASLPAGEAPPPRKQKDATEGNPFARGSVESRERDMGGSAATSNPFLKSKSRQPEGNPFADSQRHQQREDALRWLKDDQ